MQQIVDISKTYTLEEYVRIDEAGPDKHEFYNGKLIIMPGETLRHNKLCLTTYRLLFNYLSEKDYQIFVENVKVNIEGENKYVYPDISVIKEQPEADLPFKDYIIYTPLLIVEVLSDSTRKYDLTDKFILYQKISSLQYYLAVESEKPLIIFYEKEDNNNWNAKTFTELNEKFRLSKFDIELSLREIYSVF